MCGLSLDEYFQKYIFQPLGLANISLFPSEQMKSDLAHMHQRGDSGFIHGRDHLLRRPLIVEKDEISHVYNSAGAGAFARPSEYCGSFCTSSQQYQPKKQPENADRRR